MFGGKIMGMSPETINTVSGQDADTLFNCGGSITKFFHVVQTRGRQTGDFYNTGTGTRTVYKSVGHTLFRKPTNTFGWEDPIPDYWVPLETVVPDIIYSWVRLFCFVDVYTEVTPNRSKSYTVTNTSYHPQSYFETIVDSFLP